MSDPHDFAYLHTPFTKPYNYSTVTKAAIKNARLRPNQEIFVLREPDGSRASLTNANLVQQAEQLARYLITQGIKKGDVVALVGPNMLEMAVAMLGVMMAGSVVLNITISTKSALDINGMLRQANVKLMLVGCGKDNYLLPAVKVILERCNVETDSSKGNGRIKMIFVGKIDMDGFQNTDTFQKIQTRDITEVNLPNVYPEDNAIIFSTSGSTGQPKMALHTHFGLSCSPLFLTQPEVDYTVRMYNDRPFAWSGGSPIFTILRGETRVLMNAYVTMKTQNTAFLWNILKEERCTHALLLPFLIQDLIQLSKTVEDDGFRLEQITTGGQMINSSYTGVIGRVSRTMMVVYASTETAGMAWNGPLGPTDCLQAGDVGQPYPGLEVRVVDDQERPVRNGAVGKIQVRSNQLFKEYVGDQQLTKSAFTDDSWFRTGDIGKISTDGRLIMLGRETDIISRGTRKIYPGAIELLLKNIKSIKEVFVVAVPDKRLYEEVCVCFVSSEKITPDEVEQYCHEHLFTDGTVDSLGEMPTYFLQFEEFPKLANGKPDKKALRREATAKLGLTEETDVNVIIETETKKK
ncbi:putative acyl--CoA ligase YdaB [Argopecten irradians]|uniref:putative acyl--CoA ligase YdaB n=1 Tax=Argopecten irradians TaxID=31199 RepID=UPI003711BECA